MCQMIPNMNMQWAFGALLEIGDRCDRIGLRLRLLNLHEIYTSTGLAWSEKRWVNGGRWLAVSIVVSMPCEECAQRCTR